MRVNHCDHDQDSGYTNRIQQGHAGSETLLYNKIQQFLNVPYNGHETTACTTLKVVGTWKTRRRQHTRLAYSQHHRHHHQDCQPHLDAGCRD